MSAEALSWQISLGDALTGPAGKMDRALGALDDRLGSLQAPLAQLDRRLHAIGMGMDAAAQATHGLQSAQLAMLQNMNRNLFAFRKEVTELVGGLGKVEHAAAAVKAPGAGAAGAAAGGFLGDLAGPLFVLGQIVDKVKEVGGAIYSASSAFVGFALEQTQFKAGTIQTLAMMTGNRQEATALYGWMSKLADLTPMDMKDVVPMATQLLGQGYSLEQAKTLMLAVTDVAGSNTGAANMMLRQLGQMKTHNGGRGIVEQDLTPLFNATLETGAAPVSRDAVAALVAKRRGIAPAALEWSKVNFAEFESAFIDTVIKNVDAGKLGARTDQMGTGSIGGQLSTLRTSFAHMFELPEYQLSGVVGLLKNLNDVFGENSATADRLKTIFNDLFNAILGPALERYGGKDGFERLKADIDKVVSALEKVATIIEAISVSLQTLSFSALDDMGGKKSSFTSKFLGLGWTDGLLSALMTDDTPATPAPLMSPVPHGATGGVVTRPTMALIGEAGPEAVVPLNRTPGSSPLGALGGGTVVNLSVDVYVDGGSDEAGARRMASEVAQRVREELASIFEGMALGAGAV